MIKNNINSRCRYAICAIILTIVYIFYVMVNSNLSFSITNISIENALKLIEKKPDRCIYFLETSGIKDVHLQAAHLTARQACAVESAARTNPNANVQLLYALPDRNRSEHSFLRSQRNVYMEILDIYDNVHIKTIHLNEFTVDTPIEKWYLSGELQKSSYVIEHASDILRYLTLWKFGGTYLDLDVVVMKDLEPLGTDFIPAESATLVANGVLSFNITGLGHGILETFLQEISTNYKGNEWAANGPTLVTKVLQNVCNTTNTNYMTAEHCEGFRVLEPSTFYPIHWTKASYYFDIDKLNVALDMVNSSFAIHVWNKLTSGMKIKKTDNDNLYTTIAKKFCPNVYKAVDLYF